MTDEHNHCAPRFKYAYVTIGEPNPLLEDADYETLEAAIEKYASNGWRFVQAFDGLAIFEMPVNND